MQNTTDELNSSVEEVKIEDIENEDADNGEIKVLEPKKNDDADTVTLDNEGDEKGTMVKTEPKIISMDDAKYYEEKDGEEDDDFDLDETLSERLWGLTEMFPERVRNTAWTLGTLSIGCATGFYQFSRAALWIVATSAIILAAPPLIENEKAQLEELNRQQQRQILLGPSASLSGAPGLTPAIASPQAAR